MAATIVAALLTGLSVGNAAIAIAWREDATSLNAHTPDYGRKWSRAARLTLCSPVVPLSMAITLRAWIETANSIARASQMNMPSGSCA